MPGRNCCCLRSLPKFRPDFRQVFLPGLDFLLRTLIRKNNLSNFQSKHENRKRLTFTFIIFEFRRKCIPHKLKLFQFQGYFRSDIFFSERSKRSFTPLAIQQEHSMESQPPTKKKRWKPLNLHKLEKKHQLSRFAEVNCEENIPIKTITRVELASKLTQP